MVYTGVSVDRVKIISVEPYLTPNANSLRYSRARQSSKVQVVLRVYGTLILKGLGNTMRRNGMRSEGIHLNVQKDHKVTVRKKPVSNAQTSRLVF